STRSTAPRIWQSSWSCLPWGKRFCNGLSVDSNEYLFHTMRLRVAVIYGGRSGEHEISIRSAESIMKAMDESKYEILQYFISKEGKWRPVPILPEPDAHKDIDVAFPVLHGTFGEDGTVQGLLELADLP